MQVWLRFWNLLMEKWGRRPQDSAAPRKEVGRERFPTMWCHAIQISSAGSGEKQMSVKPTIHSSNKYSFIQRLISARCCYTRHSVMEKGHVSATTKLTVWLRFLSQDSAQKMNENHLCKPAINQSTNPQATPVTSQVILTRHFPMLSQVLSGFNSRHCHIGPKGDLARESVSCVDNTSLYR